MLMRDAWGGRTAAGPQQGNLTLPSRAHPGKNFRSDPPPPHYSANYSDGVCALCLDYRKFQATSRQLPLPLSHPSVPYRER